LTQIIGCGSVVLSKGKYKYQKANMVTDQDLEEVRKLLDVAEGKIRQVRMKLFSTQISSQAAMLEEDEAGNAIQGVFDGENMVGTDKKMYSVPANYASKSKLVEGDILKLTITKDGSFIYKQIGPTERAQTVATLVQDDTANWYAVKDKQQWQLLTASVTYYHGNSGDEVVILIPKEGKSRWAAVENIIRQS